MAVRLIKVSDHLTQETAFFFDMPTDTFSNIYALRRTELEFSLVGYRFKKGDAFVIREHVLINEVRCIGRAIAGEIVETVSALKTRKRIIVEVHEKMLKWTEDSLKN